MIDAWTKKLWLIGSGIVVGIAFALWEGGGEQLQKTGNYINAPAESDRSRVVTVQPARHVWKSAIPSVTSAPDALTGIAESREQICAKLQQLGQLGVDGMLLKSQDSRDLSWQPYGPEPCKADPGTLASPFGR